MVYNTSRKDIRNKLKLKKRNTMNSSPPCNQEALQHSSFQDDMEDMEDSDYDNLELTDLKNSESCNKEYDIAFQAIGEIEEIYKEQLTIAKAREWLALGHSTKKVPPFCFFRIRCTPKLGNDKLEELFKETVDETINLVSKTFYEKTIEKLDSFIKEKKNEITNKRQTAKAKIGALTPASGDARNTMYRKLGEIKNIIDNDLKKHKLDIRTSTYNSTVKKDSNSDCYNEVKRGKDHSIPKRLGRGGGRGRGRGLGRGRGRAYDRRQ